MAEITKLCELLDPKILSCVRGKQLYDWRSVLLVAISNECNHCFGNAACLQNMIVTVETSHDYRQIIFIIGVHFRICFLAICRAHLIALRSDGQHFRAPWDTTVLKIEGSCAVVTFTRITSAQPCCRAELQDVFKNVLEMC